MTLFSSGISMYAMAKLIQILHIFDSPFAWLGLPRLDLSFLLGDFGAGGFGLHSARWFDQRDL